MGRRRWTTRKRLACESESTTNSEGRVAAEAGVPEGVMEEELEEVLEEEKGVRRC